MSIISDQVGVLLEEIALLKALRKGGDEKVKRELLGEINALIVQVNRLLAKV